jgi:23S rRNA (adenine2030-N6)-methyltransferase
MLSYRHGFHAGNHADVLKHIVLCLILRSLMKKDKPFSYIDTHAGAGCYSLQSIWSEKTSEYLNGVAKIINNEDLEKLVPEYFKVIRDINDHELKLENYPGSPYIASYLSRDDDNLQFIELHPNEYENLKYNMHYCKNCHVHHREAKEGLNALLPPLIHRGLVLIDPSYEMPNDYRETIKLVKEGYRKFPQGIFAIWYPVLGKATDESYNFVRELKKIGINATIQAELSIATQDRVIGMNASGMIICNAPFQLDEELLKIMPILANNLAIDNGANFKVEYLTPRI